MYFFDYLGAFYYWIYLVAVSKIRNRKPPTFAEIREGKGMYEEDDFVDMNAYGFKLKVIGGIVTVLICWAIVKSGI